MPALSQKLIDITEDILIEWANDATQKMRDNLQRNLKENSQVSLLAQSIVFDGTNITPDGITLFWELNDYWMFVDLGVKGVVNRSKTYTSKDYPAGFQFKNYGTPPQMINAMQSYIARKGVKVRETNKQSAKSVIEKSFEKAKQMAFFVKRKGITGTRFYSDVFNDKNFKLLTDKLEKEWGVEIEFEIIKEFQK